MWQHFKSLYRLIRLDKPIGIYVFLWPTLTALWLASGGVPTVKHLVVFTLGTIVMRSAGCIINDIADKSFDHRVKRTKQRPLTTNALSVRAALCWFVLLLVVALGLVLQLNTLCLLIACFTLAATIVYPFTKRFLDAPQLVLGLAVASSVPMAFAAVQNTVPFVGWLLYLPSLLLPIAYDTMYALVDKDDDLVIGIRSTAIWFGRFDRCIIGGLQLASVGCFLFVGHLMLLAWPYYLGVLAASVLFLYQQYLIKDRQRERCFNAFLNNHWALLFVFLGVVMSFS